MLGENCTFDVNPKGVWLKSASAVGIWLGVRCITVAGVANSLPPLCCCLLLELASLVGGGVCICEKSMAVGRCRPRWLAAELTPTRLTKLGSGDDDSLLETSTGGKGKLFGTKWLTWNSGSSGVRGFKLYELDGRSLGVERVKDGVCAGVCCPCICGVAQGSRKCDWDSESVLGVLSVDSGKVTDLGVEEGLGRCQSVDLAHDPH
jgi:hypothetical protein